MPPPWRNPPVATVTPMVTLPGNPMFIESLCRAVVLLLCLAAVGHGTDAALAEQRLANGMALVQANRPSEALPLLESCLTDLEGADRRRVVNRLIGHLYWGQAQASDGGDERVRLLHKASDRYLVAGDDGDIMARRHYLANEGVLSAERGYEAGWRFISWNGLGAVDGWFAVLGNYGATMTRGKGIPGLIDAHPLHALVWGILIAVLLLLAITGLLRKPLPPPPPQAEPPPPVVQRTPLPVQRTPAPAQRTPLPLKRPSGTDHLARRPSSGHQPAPAIRGVKPAIPVPATGARTPRSVPVPPSSFRTPKPDLDRLRNLHLSQNSPQKSETASYERGDLPPRVPGAAETDPDIAPLTRKPNREETEPGGNPILPPGGRQPPTPPRRPR